VEEQRLCKSGAQAADGSNCSSSKEEASSTSETEEPSMPFKTKRVKELKFKEDLAKTNSFGRLSILTRRMLESPRDFTQNSDSTATDHSTLSQDSQ
jgi:hypothetical protein